MVTRDCNHYAIEMTPLFILRHLCTVRQLVEHTEALVQHQGFETVQPHLAGDRAWARPLEVAAALNRLRTLRIGGPCTETAARSR